MRSWIMRQSFVDYQLEHITIVRHIYLCYFYDESFYTRILVAMFTIMSIKSKIMNTITGHPKLAMFGIGLAVTFAISMTIGRVDHQEALAMVRCRYC
jgi:xanthine/uracil/vitamin C permease (AzgA family)